MFHGTNATRLPASTHSRRCTQFPPRPLGHARSAKVQTPPAYTKHVCRVEHISAWCTCLYRACAVRGSAEHTCRSARSRSSSPGMMCCDALQHSRWHVMLMPPNAAFLCPWPGRHKQAWADLHGVKLGQKPIQHCHRLLRKTSGCAHMQDPKQCLVQSIRSPLAARGAFLPHAQALLRHREDALTQPSQHALLRSWVQPQHLAQPLHTCSGAPPARPASQGRMQAQVCCAGPTAACCATLRALSSPENASMRALTACWAAAHAKCSMLPASLAALSARAAAAAS